MNYPYRRYYHGIRAHIHWMKDLAKWRKWNRECIKRLGVGECIS